VSNILVLIGHDSLTKKSISFYPKLESIESYDVFVDITSYSYFLSSFIDETLDTVVKSSGLVFRHIFSNKWSSTQIFSKDSVFYSDYPTRCSRKAKQRIPSS